MDEERPLHEARQAMSQTPGEAGAGAAAVARSGNRPLMITGVLLVVVLIIAGLFLPPISLGQYLGLGAGLPTVVDTPAEPDLSGEFGVTVTDANRQVRVGKVDAAAFRDGSAGEAWAAAAAALPADLSLQSAVYTVAFDEGNAPTGQVALSAPANVTQLDVYRWDGSSWQFTPTRHDAASGRLVTDELPLGSAYAVMQAASQTAVIAAERLPEFELSADLLPLLDETVASGLILQGNGLAGEPAPALGGASPEFLRTTNTGVIVDQASLATLLGDPAAVSAHITALVDAVRAGGFDGLNLDYQGVDPSQQAAFTGLVRQLADALHAENMQLVVTLGTPAGLASGRYDSGGQDWAAIGSLADAVYVQLPLNPTLYGDGGQAQQLLDYAVRRLDRRQISVLLAADAVDMLGELFLEIPNQQALASFGELNLIEGAETIEPGMTVEVGLAGDATPLEWDASSLTYRYNYGGEGQLHTVWLGSEAALAHRMRFAHSHNLRGVVIRGLASAANQAGYITAIESFRGLAVAPQPAAAAIVWLVEDESGGVVASEAGDSLRFAWQAPEAEGQYVIKSGIAQGENVANLGAVTVVVALPEPTAEPEEAEEPVAEATPEATPGTAAPLSPISPGDADAVVNIAANVRTGPGLAYPRVGDGLQRGERVKLIGRNEASDWLNIILPDGATEGWIFHTLVDVNVNVSVAALPVKQVDPPPVTSSGGSTNVGPPPPPIGNTGFELGGQTHSLANPTLMAYAGMRWVKFQHKWSPGQNGAELAGRIGQAHANGFKVLLSIPGANTYPSSIDFNAYVTFLGQVAAQGPDAIEVWNEQNIDFEWPAGQIDPSSYVNNMLRPAYQAIKAANASVMVVGGAPAPTGFDNGTNAWADSRYMAGMAAAGAANYMDCIGIHYNEGIIPPSQRTGDPRGGHYTRYFWGMVDTYWNAFGGSRPLCFTELGYLSGDGFSGLPSRFAWAATTNVQEHAAWLAEAASLSSSSGKVRMLIVFNVDFTYYDPNGDPQAGYAMIRPDGSCPSCETLRSVTGGR